MHPTPESPALMASPDTWTLDDARERIETPKWLPSHRAFAEGDHLQAGTLTASGLATLSSAGGLAGWIAPMLPSGHPHYRNQFDGIVRGFVSSNKIGEVIGRHKAGVAGRQPSRGFESREPIPQGKEIRPELLRLKETADGWMAARWEAEGMHGAFQSAIACLLYSGRQPARLLLPRGYLTEGRNGTKVLPRVPLADMLNMLRLTFPKPEECTVYTDPDTFEQVGIFTYEVDTKRYAEVTWVDRASGLTHVRQVGEGAEAGTKDEATYDFNGRIPMYEMVRSVFVTPQMVQNNKALNLALSSIPRNVWAAGARERTYFNVDQPGEEIVNADGTKTFVVKEIDMGAGVANFLNGAPVWENNDPKTGNIVGYANPSMQITDPVDIGPAKAAVDAHAWEILSEARQLHAVMTADATASGVSRIVARVEFMGTLGETKPTVDGCLEWEADTRLAMAEAFTGGREGGKAPHPYSAYLRANAECKLDPGPITPEERTALKELVADGIYSKEYIRVMMGTEDSKEEETRVATEQRVERILSLIERADSIGMDRYEVLTRLGGLEPEEARALARGDVVPPGVTQ